MKRLGRWLLILVLLAGAAGGAAWWWQNRTDTDAAAQSGNQSGTQSAGGRGRGGSRRGAPGATAVPVVTARAETRDVPIFLDALGTVQAFNSVSVRSQVDGTLVEIAFREGQDVKAGDVLARVDPRPFQATLDAAVAKKQQDEANLANARLDAARYQKLVAGNFSSQQQADTARAQVAQLEAQVRGDQAQVDTARTQLGYATITAPFDGRTGIRQVDVGNIVHSGDTTPITMLTQLQPISVLFTLPQQNLPAIADAMAAGSPEVQVLPGSADTGARVAAAPGTAGAAAGEGDPRVIETGQLTVLDNQVDPATGTVKLKATLPNRNRRLWPGAFVNVRLLVRTERGVTTVPPAAIQRGPRGSYVYVVDADMGVKRTPVRIAHEDEAVTIVASGLKPGDQVVTDGAQRLDETSKVAIAQPDGNAPGAAPRERSAPGTAERRSRRNAS